MDKKYEIENECISNKNIVSKMHCHSFDPYVSEILLPNLVKDHTHAPYEVVSQKAFRQKCHRPDEASCSGLNQQTQNLNNSERSISSYRGSHMKEQDLVASCGTATSGYFASYPLVQSKGDFLVGYFPSSSCSMTAVAEDGAQPKDVARGGKQRIRWTQELHEQFVAAVNSLGGPMKATPRGILSLMKSQGLTIFHIKSHLQKYRNTKHLPNLHEGKGGCNPDGEYISNLKGTGGLHISEALQLQMDVQRTLHEHLEFQKRLQLRIEEQANYLQWLFDQQKICSNFNENHNLNKQMDTSPPECSSTEGYTMYSRVQHR